MARWEGPRPSAMEKEPQHANPILVAGCPPPVVGELFIKNQPMPEVHRTLCSAWGNLRRPRAGAAPLVWKSQLPEALPPLWAASVRRNPWGQLLPRTAGLLLSQCSPRQPQAFAFLLSTPPEWGREFQPGEACWMVTLSLRMVRPCSHLWHPAQPGGIQCVSPPGVTKPSAAEVKEAVDYDH